MNDKTIEGVLECRLEESIRVLSEAMEHADLTVVSVTSLVPDFCVVSVHVAVLGISEVLFLEFKPVAQDEFTFIELFQRVQVHAIIVDIVDIELERIVNFDGFLDLEFVVFKCGKHLRELNSLTIGDELGVTFGC